ncbi:hypothetical protein IE077_001962 [Cardiosporidium cionae]|uniref:Uncharacterized protein n=1 Tax=Cardiosporidium cionae TaxID=476202 RepID=A0ABQ7JCZ9_9APIC|nr:hypothetical protein IE077_001962 [Cardiosporidium cionae]|eukprot:KAF8821500.1 hypothetical protein IE077_001962 [Cardiosporidium cionae]
MTSQQKGVPPAVFQTLLTMLVGRSPIAEKENEYARMTQSPLINIRLNKIKLEPSLLVHLSRPFTETSEQGEESQSSSGATTFTAAIKHDDIAY